MEIKHLLMSKPTYFSIDYSINPWMDINNPVDSEKAHEQWYHLCDTLRKLGVRLSFIEPVKGLPDMTFTGDCGMVHGNKFIRSNFRHQERKGEAEIFAKWIENHGYEVFRLPEQIHFEGLGDVVYYGNDIIFGYGPRSDQAAVEEVKRILPELNVRGELYIKDEAFFHVALAVSFIAQDTLLYYPPAFDEQSRDFIKKSFAISIPVSESDAKEFFVCNNIPIGNKLLLDNCSGELEAQLNRIGIEVIKCDMGEFKKSGGSLRCLVLKL